VNAAIEQVTVATDGSMDIPKLPMDVAWYKLGPRPGEKGSAVIDGHVDWENGAKAIFLDLHNLKPGDKIEVQDTQGVTIPFVVRTSQTYDPNADDSGVFVSNDGKAHLNLITCSGVWNNVAKGYSQRLVIFADEEVE
jgi:LPXTG-site transpeptidase (sortase) family protein